MNDNRRQIWIVANTSWYVYNFRGRLISILIKDGYDVTAFSPQDKYVPRIEALGARHVHLALDNAGTNILRDLVAILRIAAVIRRERPMVILTYTPKVNIYVSLAARMLRIPVVANVSGLGRAFIAGGWLEFIARLLYRAALRHPRVVFFQNEEDRVAFIKGGLITMEKAKRLPGSGVDVNRFKPRSKDERERPFVFLLAARLLWDKGVGDYVEAARRVRSAFPNVEFWIVGFLDVHNPSAISREQIDQWVSEGLLKYLGSSDTMEEIYRGADCMVLPSYYREGVPRTLLEAASMGLPVITTDSVGCRDAVDDGTTGYLCHPKDVNDLENKMRQMLMLSSEKRLAMGRAGRDKMLREFDEQIVLDNYLKAVRSIEADR